MGSESIFRNVTLTPIFSDQQSFVLRRLALIFLAVSGWMLWHLLEDASTREPSLWGLATAALGLVVYYLSPRKKTAA